MALLIGECSSKGKQWGSSLTHPHLWIGSVRYFTTSSPMSGIFVPLSRATKRNSAQSSNPPPTPPLSSYSAPMPGPSRRSDSPGPRSLGSSLARPAGGRPSLSRPESPVRRPPGGRPSLLPPITPRHASAAAGTRLVTPGPAPGKFFSGERGRAGSVSVGLEPEGRPGTSGGVPRITPVPKQMGTSLGVKKHNAFPLRSPSAMERRGLDDEISSPIDMDVPGVISNGQAENETTIAALEKKLTERERQLDEQTASLVEMEQTLIELQSLIGSAQHNATSQMMLPRNIEDADASQLRALLREKNEKIQQLNTEFDMHRADFRSTIDTLELASSETVRVYEKRVEDLLAENRELQERGEDVESVARQLKQLEELVAELEEGLEDARRGEAEARGEVEFLRGEVERSKEELRREKEKSAAAVANAAVGNMLRNSVAEELEKKDEEIRGLKAIIHSLSRDTVSDDDELTEPAQNGHINGRSSSDGFSNGESSRQDGREETDHSASEALAKERELREKLEQRIHELEAQVKAKAERESQLEREIELMERDRRNSVISERPAKTNSVYSVASEIAFQELTKPMKSANSVTINTDVARDSVRDPKGTFSNWRSARLSPHEDHSMLKLDEDADGDQEAGALWCEMCETAGHDILTCTSMFGSSENRAEIEAKPGGVTSASTPIDADGEVAPLSIRSSSPIEVPETEIAMSPTAGRKKSVHLPAPPPMIGSGVGPVAGKESGVVDDNKWCALCERDGHDSVDCPFDEDAF